MARFISKYNNYQILVKPTILEVKNGIPILSRGEKIVFEDGEFVTEDKKTVDLLRKHKAKGVDFIEDKPVEKEPDKGVSNPEVK